MLSSLINRLEAELPEAIREDRGSKKERKKGKNGRTEGWRKGLLRDMCARV